MKSLNILVSFLFIGIVCLFLFLAIPTGACSPCYPEITNSLAFLLSPNPTFNGSCNAAEKNYCIEYLGYYDSNAQSSFCKLTKGSFVQNGKCSKENFAGKCKVTNTSCKFYYSPFDSATSKIDCDRIGGVFSESFN